MKVIDIHAHFFNVPYFPVFGIIDRYVLSKAGKVIRLDFEKTLPVLQDMIPEYDDIIAGEGSEISDSIFYKFIETDLFTFEDAKKENQRISFSDLVIEQWNNVPVIKSLDQTQFDILEEAYQALPDEFKVEGDISTLSINGRALKIFKYIEALTAEAILQEKNKTETKLPPNLIRWILFMFLPQWLIMAIARKTFKDVKLFVNHLIDAEPSFKGPNLLPIKSQIKKTEKLQVQNEFHKVNSINFIGFHPDRKRGRGRTIQRNPIKLIDYAKKHGFKGVKYYGPMGYNPCSDEELHHKLFTLCSDKEHPLSIFAHTTTVSGFGNVFSKIDGIKNNTPNRWITFLSEYSSVNVCFAHAGGHDGWFSDQSKFDPTIPLKDRNDEQLEMTLPIHCIDVCRNYSNAYMEFGFFNELSKSDKRSSFVKNLMMLYLEDRAIINSGVQNHYPVLDKIMFGTDWHTLMNEKVDGIDPTNTYFYYFKTAIEELKDQLRKLSNDVNGNKISEAELILLEENIFYRNALRYLNLPEDYLDTLEPPKA